MAMRRLQGEAGIVQYVEVFTTAEEYCLVTERMPNSTNLVDFLDQATDNGGLSEPEVESIFRQMLNAVGTIHDHGLDHNDLSVTNILIDADSFVVTIIDFGLAEVRSLGQLGELSLLKIKIKMIFI